MLDASAHNKLKLKKQNNNQTSAIVLFPSKKKNKKHETRSNKRTKKSATSFAAREFRFVICLCKGCHLNSF